MYAIAAADAATYSVGVSGMQFAASLPANFAVVVSSNMWKQKLHCRRVIARPSHGFVQIMRTLHRVQIEIDSETGSFRHRDRTSSPNWIGRGQIF